MTVLRVADDADIADPGQARRREIGQELQSRRKKAGLKQETLGGKMGYTRSYVSNAERGHRPTNRRFWRACDEALGTGTFFRGRFDDLFPGTDPDPGPDPGDAVPGGELPLSRAVRGTDSRKAEAAYLRLGWPAGRTGGGTLALATGTAADAFEVHPVAGCLAARLWIETGGRADLVRGLPELPPPASHLAVIDAGGKWYVLVRAGSCPWAPPVPAGGARGPADPAIVWHADGSRVPLPPAAGRWAYLPDRSVLLPPPLAVMHLLGAAAALIRPGAALALPGGAVVMPAACPALACPAYAPAAASGGRDVPLIPGQGQPAGGRK